MNSHLLKVSPDHHRADCSPAVSPASWKERCSQGEAPSASHSVNNAELDRCLRRQAQVKAQQGDYSEAIALLNQLIKQNLYSAIDYNNRGLVYFQSGQFLQAIADYNTALQLNPQLASAYNNRANYYAACGQLDSAIADYDRATDLNPSHVRAWINRGITLRDLGRYEQAIENFDVAQMLGQLEGNIYAERGRTYHLWGDWNCCIADYRRALTKLNQQGDSSSELAASRLRLQVETWLKQLLDQ